MSVQLQYTIHQSCSNDVFENTNYIENRSGSAIRDDISVHYGRNGFHSKAKLQRDGEWY